MYLFVYGTLKKGKHNHGYLLDSVFVGDFNSSDNYSLIISGLPFLVKRRSELGVKGEVYKIDSNTLKELDRLEGHPTFYKREVITVYNNETKEPLEVYAYIHPDVFNHNFEFPYKLCQEF